jgi:Two component regulator propeller
MNTPNQAYLVPGLFMWKWRTPATIICMLFLFFLLPKAYTQQNTSLTPIGLWREHLPYQNTIDLVKTENKIFCATANSLFSVDLADNDIERLSKVNGLNDIGISRISYDAIEKKLIITYTNSNIDLFDGNNTINITDFKRKSILGDKTIYNIFTYNSLAYLSTGIGIVVVDEKKYEIKDSYFIGAGGSYVKINGVTTDGTWLYAATGEGLKRAQLNSINLADYRNWQNISSFGNENISDVLLVNNTVIVSKNDSLYNYKNNVTTFLYRDAFPIISCRIAEGKLIICHRTNAGDSKVVVLSENGTVEKTIAQPGIISFPKQALLVNGNTWTADFFGGLSKNTGTSFNRFIPNGPPAPASGEIAILNHVLWAGSGEVNSSWNYQYNRNGILRFKEDKWKTYNQFNGYPQLDSALDFITVAIDPKDETLWSGSYGGGLAHITADDKLQIFKQNSTLQPAIGDPTSYRVSGLAFDTDNNLWISNYGAANNISVRKADGSFKSFRIPFFLSENAVAQIITDDNNYKWIISPKGNGLICYNSGSSIDATNDDQWKYFRNGVGQGNLPNNEVLSIAKDKQGIIWIGTTNGIGIIACGADVFSPQGCNAILPVVQSHQFAGYLFQGEAVQAVAVDGDNRKWIGTKNGVWLISPDGDKTILRFTEDNSPLLNNDVKKIAIDGQTGEVFFATFKGICSYRATATDGGVSNQNLLVFPNPVPAGFTGTIAIKGLAENAFVKITELNGRLVYQTRALGGQAVWNGLDLNKRKVNAGVYLVLVTDETRIEKAAAKIFELK